MSKAQIEKKYGIHIVKDSYFHPLEGKMKNAYTIYSADGCCWEKGLCSIKEIEEECKRWEDALLHIKTMTKRFANERLF